MTTKVEKSILVNVPVRTAYNQWTQFEDFPKFMHGVERVTQLADDKLEWEAQIAGVRRRWTATILEQVPDVKVAWAADEGATNAGAVMFADNGVGQTEVRLSLEFEPEGFVEAVGDKLGIVHGQAEGDLERFKEFIESRGEATGAWRGEVNAGGGVGIPTVEDAATSRGDSGVVNEKDASPFDDTGSSGLGVGEATDVAPAGTLGGGTTPAGAAFGEAPPEGETGADGYADDEGHGGRDARPGDGTAGLP